MNFFSKTPESWQEVVHWIQKIPLGKLKLIPFLEAVKKGRISLQPFPEDLRHKLQEVQFDGNPLGAAFVTDGREGNILFDGQGELGILIPFLFHEIIHSLDESLWFAARTPLASNVRRRLVFDSELLAFSEQYRFQEDFKEVFPELRSFHESQYAGLDLLNRELSPDEISLLYK